MSEKRHVIEVAHVNKNFRDNKVLKDISSDVKVEKYMGWWDIMDLGKQCCSK
ncbi:MAG: hypothetical protein V8S53_02035 [Lachnospiraceae bacterium]